MTIEKLISTTSSVLDEFNIIDEDMRQDVYLAVIQNSNKLLNCDDVIDSIKDIIIKCYNNNITEQQQKPQSQCSHKYDKYILCEILADGIFNKLPQPYKTAIIVKFELDPTIKCRLSSSEIDMLSAEAMPILKKWANTMADRDAIVG